MRNIDLLKHNLRVYKQHIEELRHIGHEITKLRQEIKIAIIKEGRRL